MRLLILTILTIFATNSFGQDLKDSVQFSIHFTKCFKNDTLSLKLNGVEIFINKIATTDQVDDVTNVYVYQSKKALWFDSNKRLPKLKVGNILSLDIYLHGHSERFTISLKKGKHILIDKCHGKGNFLNFKELSTSQLKIAPEFD